MSDVSLESVVAQAHQLSLRDRLQLLERLQDELFPIPEAERNELAALAQLSDAALWTIAKEQMPADQQARMQLLMDGNTRGTLSDQEHAELAQRVEQGQQLMLRKAKAMSLLTDRGHTITREALH